MNIVILVVRISGLKKRSYYVIGYREKVCQTKYVFTKNRYRKKKNEDYN